MPDADCRCTPAAPWSLGRGGQTPSPSSSSSELNLQENLDSNLGGFDPNPPPLTPLALPPAVLSGPPILFTRRHSRGKTTGKRQQGARLGRAREGRSEGSELCDTFDPLDWKMAAASLWPPPPPPRALASIRLQVTRWQNRFFQTFVRAEADYSDCRTREALGFRIKGTQGR